MQAEKPIIHDGTGRPFWLTVANSMAKCAAENILAVVGDDNREILRGRLLAAQSTIAGALDALSRE